MLETLSLDDNKLTGETICMNIADACARFMHVQNSRNQQTFFDRYHSSSNLLMLGTGGCQDPLAAACR